MQIPRFFIDPDNIDEAAAQARISDPKLVHQIVKVLRLGVGARVILLNGEGGLFHSCLQRVSKDSIEASIERAEHAESADVSCAGELTVALALIKPSRFEWALEKLTELGATTIIPLVTKRTVSKSSDNEDGKKKEGKTNNVKMERWQSIVREAAEQSERYAIPRVVAPQTFDEYLKSIATKKTSDQLPSEQFYILAERNDCMHLSMHLAEMIKEKKLQSISLCVGPEGGFTDAELFAAAEAGLTFASLGKLILRSETAAIASASIAGAVRNT